MWSTTVECRRVDKQPGSTHRHARRSAPPAKTLARAAAALLLSGTLAAPVLATTAATITPIAVHLEPHDTIGATPELLAEGRKLYANNCAPCHGDTGRGDGEASYLLYPRPRDFVTGRFRFVSTWEGAPTDADIYRSISRGMPGSAMPAWAHLSERQRWALVHVVKAFAEKPTTVAPASPPKGEGEKGTGLVEVPPEPPYDDAAKARARELFVEACAACHGKEARGDAMDPKTDEQGYPIRPRDLNTGIFKGSPDPEHLYRRILIGIPGTPMPSSEWAYGNDAWHLVHYVRALSSDTQRSRAEMRRFSIPVKRVRTLPDHPDAKDWMATVATNLHMMPLWWRYDRPEELNVRALHDGKDIAIRLSWRDDTHDATAMRPQDFRDAAAIELSATADPPFFAMGQKAQHVSIWMWKAERQADLEPAFQDLEKVYPNLGIDSYPNLLRSPLEQPLRHALTLQSNPVFVTAWGAGNIVADPTRGSAAEDLTAQGFGTLRARPPTDQAVAALGAWEMDTYAVTFRRSLAGRGANAVSLKPGSTVPIAFAVWNGSGGDRDGKKSVTIWQELKVE